MQAEPKRGQAVDDVSVDDVSVDDVTVLITGGGTAGHTNPGIAVAQALVAAGVPAANVHFVGGERGNERELVPAAGFSIDLLPGRGIRRSLSAEAVSANLGAVAGLAKGLFNAFRLVRRRRPSVVLCLGGYAAFGASFAAVLNRVPLVVTEQNARASAVNRLMGRFSVVNALPYPDTDLPNGAVTGNPIRLPLVEALEAADRSSACASLGLDPERTVVAVWAGSLGARSINNATVALAERWRDRDDLTLYHIVGRRDWPEVGPRAVELDSGALDYRAVEYEDNMPAVQVAADLAICRSGASTTAELAVAGLPAVLVPLPGAPRDHQRANGRELVASGGALHLDDGSLEGLADLVEPLLADSSVLEAMADRARSVGRPGAAVAVARLCLDHARPALTARPTHTARPTSPSPSSPSSTSTERR